ncbi:hypothetical protein DHEL01_v201675 [Diaporthe helianthi]|uniref:Uncharacterized protein n=1 Tax=Diaporthe helianthi TaxID=158607 RepID=A0A2P5IBN8_DIAHE|nr:hypothetical protein DHEL01_v201675 [Diaporthe helianthi]
MAPDALQSVDAGKKRPSRKKDGKVFEFVVDTSATPHGDSRTVVRRQAARSGARLRKTRGAKTGTPSKDEELSSAQEEHKTESGTLECDLPSMLRPLAAGTVKQPSFSAYEATRVIYNFDITALESFINVDLPIIGYNLIIQDCLQHSGALLRNGDSSSFLAHLPARYGSSPFLDDAVHCVAARAAQMLGRSKASTSPSLLYGKALRSLNRGIQAGSWADVYCATRLFVLYELISDMHEKQSSMFEAQKWQNFFEVAACRAPGRDARFWWKLFGSVCFMPGIVKDARRLFCSPTLGSFEYMSENLTILLRVEKLLQTLLLIHQEYKQSSDSQTQLSLYDLPSSSAVESPDRIRLRQFLQFPVMFLSRLRASLSLSEDDRGASEEEAQRTAAQTLHAEKVARSADPDMAWHYAQRNNLPYSIIRTREEWLPISERGQNWEELKIYLAERWLKWDNSWHDTVLVKEMGDGKSEEGNLGPII